MARRKMRRLVFCFAALALAASVDRCQAGHPYYLLRAPQVHSHVDQEIPLDVHPYAYGWFGARPYPHGVHHRGFYNNAWYWNR
jgi:hypothetical protein